MEFTFLPTCPQPSNCAYNSCPACVLTDFEFMRVLTGNFSELLRFLYSHGVLSCHVLCRQCDSRVHISENEFERIFYRCYKTVIRGNKKRAVCHTKSSAVSGTFFEKSHLSLRQVVHLTHIFLSSRRARVVYAQSEVDCSRKTVIDWFSFCREVIIDYVKRHSGKIGGPGIIVEIDEALLGKRKSNKGRLLSAERTQQWIVGGIQRSADRREAAKVFLVPVADRSAASLIELIKNYVEEGTTIMTDCWRGYEALQHENFRHFTVNHSLNFVDPTTGAHTQKIERLWVEVRKYVPRAGFKRSHLPGYLADTIFRKMIPDYRLRRHVFWQAAATLYPPEEHTLA